MMSSLIFLLVLMLLIALCLAAIPFAKSKTVFSKKFFICEFFIILFCVSAYLIFGNYTGLSEWNNRGEEHYNLLDTFDRLGGVDGAIKKIEDELMQNPKDAEGWYILGKLYLSKHEDAKAKAAFENARRFSSQPKE